MSIKDFQILGQLGKGAYSSVYKARRLVDGQEYALKKVLLNSISEKQRLNAVNQGRILASMQSKHVIAYKEAFIDQSSVSLWIVMENAQGGDLYNRIVQQQKKGQYFQENFIWKIFVQIVLGLQALHSARVLHRDLKSANIFLKADGCVKIGDMNVSKVTRGLCQTQTGTPYYASPEVWKDQSYDRKSDIWSLGCVLYQMVTLKPPFRAEDMQGLFKKVVRGVYPKIPGEYSSQLANMVKNLLQISPMSRPSCQKIMQNVVVQKWLSEIGYEHPTINLIRTIKMPSNLRLLTQSLPKANYKQKSKRKRMQSISESRREQTADSPSMERKERADSIGKKDRKVKLSEIQRQINRLNQIHQAIRRKRQQKKQMLERELEGQKQHLPAISIKIMEELRKPRRS